MKNIYVQWTREYQLGNQFYSKVYLSLFAAVDCCLDIYLFAIFHELIPDSVRRSSSIYLCPLHWTCLPYMYACVRGYYDLGLFSWDLPAALNVSDDGMLAVILVCRVRLLILENSCRNKILGFHLHQIKL